MLMTTILMLMHVGTHGGGYGAYCDGDGGGGDCGVGDDCVDGGIDYGCYLDRRW